MNARVLVVSVIVGIILILGGVGLGILYQTGKTPIQTTETPTQTVPDSISILSSKVVGAITARGKVTKVGNKTVTLVYQSDTRTIAVRSDAVIYALTANPKTLVNKNPYISKPATFQDIKVDNNIEMSVRVLPSGQIEAYSIMILPSPVATPTTTPTKTTK